MSPDCSPPPAPSAPTERLGEEPGGPAGRGGCPLLWAQDCGYKAPEGGAPDPTLPAAIYQKLKITQE